MRRSAAAVVALCMAATVWAVEPAQATNPALVSPYFPSVFVTFAGFGKATPVMDQRLAETGQSKRQLSWTPSPGDSAWFKLLNNTRWTISLTTYSMYLEELRDGAQISVHYEALDQRGSPIPSPYDLFATINVSSDRSVLFPVAREALRGDGSVRVDFRYDWEPAQTSSWSAPVHHEVLISRFMLPLDNQEAK